jgi:hypothetical protein
MRHLHCHLRIDAVAQELNHAPSVIGSQGCQMGPMLKTPRVGAAGRVSSDVE